MIGKLLGHSKMETTARYAHLAREAGLDRLDDAGRSVADHQQRVAQAAGAHVVEERDHRLGVFFRTRHQVQEDLRAVRRESPGRQNRLAPAPRTVTFRNPVDEQIDDLVLGQVP